MYIYGEYIYSCHLKTITAFNYQELLTCFAILQHHIDTQANGYFLGYFSYEAGVLMQTYGKDLFTQVYENINQIQQKRLEPIAYFKLFAKRQKIPKTFFKQSQPLDKQSINLQIIKNIDLKTYQTDFFSIKDSIAKGDTYQVNYTQEMILRPTPLSQSNIDTMNPIYLYHNQNKQLHTNIHSDLRLFQSLCSKQNAPYKAFFHNEFLTLLSFSPELFFSIKRRHITTQPMKGTIQRGTKKDSKHSFRINKKSDKKLKKQLQQDSKNRSENVMIVDLLRNDLSRINNIKKVKVKKLFAIHSYTTLHQMISTIQAKLPRSFQLLDIFLSLFPCGSITGAPKLKTLEIIQRLEQRNRGIYCGAMGVVSNKKIIFSIPIRTLIKYTNEKYYRYGVGSGIIWDSKLEQEIQELQLKCAFLTKV
ncbi:anthranilate synthase component I family protein [Helicobacter aurati]|uniref:Anthranilate synthase component I family protein n=1 Tax=Helicobacter aurati TaxID=137778 RepID=A0A3D8J9U1_9HELI|nr:chorismate-binding protein [Helicobacter aurati]RDU73661.1 anthranilate synthase component I family protein [Helicobacter aurati]